MSVLLLERPSTVLGPQDATSCLASFFLGPDNILATIPLTRVKWVFGELMNFYKVFFFSCDTPAPLDTSAPDLSAGGALPINRAIKAHWFSPWFLVLSLSPSPFE